jgi:hypothetical protein
VTLLACTALVMGSGQNPAKPTTAMVVAGIQSWTVCPQAAG